MDLTKGEFGGTIGEGIPPSAAKLKIEKTEHPSTVTPIDQAKVVQETFPIGQQAKPEQPVAQSQAPALEPKQSAPVSEQKQVEDLTSAATQAPAQKLFASANDTAGKIEQSRLQSSLIASKPENAPVEPVVKSAPVGNTPEVRQVISGPTDQNQLPSATRQSYTPASFETPKSPAADTSRSDYSKVETPVLPTRYADTGGGAILNRNISDQKDPTSRVLDTLVSKTITSSEGAAYSALQQGQVRAEVQEAGASMSTSAKLAQRETVQPVSDGAPKGNVTEVIRQDGSRTEREGASKVGERSDNKIDAVKTETSRNAEVRVAGNSDVQTAKPPEVQSAKPMSGERNEASQVRLPDASGSSGQKSFTENTPNQNRPDARSGVTDSGSRGVGGGGSSSFDNPGVRSPGPQSAGSTQPVKEIHPGSDSSAGGSTGTPLDDSLGQKPNKIDANQNVPADSGSRGVGGGSSSTVGSRLADLPDKIAHSDSSTTPASKQGEQSAAVSADNVGRPDRQPPKLDGELIGPILDGDKKAKPTDVVQPTKRDPVEISNQISRELDRLLTNKAMQPKILAVIEHLLDKKPLPGDVPKDLLDVVKHTDPDRLKTLSVVIRGALAQQELLQTNPKATPLVDVALIADSSVVRARKGIDNADADEILEKKIERTQASSDEDFTEAIAALKKMRQLFRELQEEIPIAQRVKDVVTDELELGENEERSSNDGAAANIPQASASATYVPPHDESLEEIALRLLGDRNLAPLLMKVNPRVAVGAGNVVVAGSTINLPNTHEISLYRRTI
jgi:hypothetical protein